jgi:MoaA/NifB/PqqE/SkfB family radical SAM enzyme
VRRLIDAKGGPGRLPLVNIVFMPMKANVGELDAFVRMCAGLQVDHLVLRPLNYQDDINEVWDRAGYHFDYRQELLPFEELVRTSGRAAELCRRAGVPLADQMDFGGSLGGRFADWYEEGRRSVSPSSAPVAGAAPDGPAEPAGPADAAAAAPEPPPGSDRGPVCGEPWKSLYILRRGVYPCCYGSQPVAPMDEFKDAWNSPVLQAIRRDLSRGRFHRYCLESPACPIVRKAGASRELPVAHELRKRAQRASTRLADYRRRASWARQWAAIRLRRIVTEPGYVRHHVSRLLGRAGRR